MKNLGHGYSATYTFDSIGGEPGWSYNLYHQDRLVTSGWSRGKKREAEADVRQAIHAREALRAAAASTSTQEAS